MFKEKMIKLLEPTALEIVFMQLKEGNNKIILWQSSSGGNNKNSIHVRLGQVNPTKGEMTFFPMKGEFAFHPDNEVYFFGYRRTTIFKATIRHYSKIKLVINLPTEVMLNNSRKEERQDHYQNQALIHYTFNAAMSSGLERLYLHSRLIDLSPTGLSFKSPRGNSIRFKKGEHLWIRSPLKENKYLVEGEIRHVTTVSDLTTREKYLRVGVAYIS